MNELILRSDNKNNRGLMKIAGQTYSVLIDTGADVTCINNLMVQSIPTLRNLPLTPSQYSCLQSATNDKIKVRGVITFPAEINNTPTTVTAHVTDNISQSLILGVDHIQDNKWVLDYSTGQLKVRTNYLVKSASTVNIPPRCEVIVQGCLGGRLPKGISGSCESTRILPTIGLIGARVIASTDQRFVPVRVMNPGDTEIELRKGTRVAMFKTLSATATIHTLSDSVSGKVANDHEMSFNIDEDHLTESEKGELLKALYRNQDVFVGADGKLGKTSILRHEIKLEKGAQPIRRRVYRTNPAVQKVIDEQIDKMLEQGIIEP
jgi:predicted aspartyl protease